MAQSDVNLHTLLPLHLLHIQVRILLLHESKSNKFDQKFSKFLPNFSWSHGGIKKKLLNLRETNISSKRDASLYIQACGVKVRAKYRGTLA